MVFPSELTGKLLPSAERLSSRVGPHQSLGAGASCSSPATLGAETPPPSTSDAKVWAHEGHFSVLFMCPEERTLTWTKDSSARSVCPPKAASRQPVPASRGSFLPLPVLLTLKPRIISLGVGGLVKTEGLREDWRAENAVESLNQFRLFK